jgi:hypothetical protein
LSNLENRYFVLAGAKRPFFACRGRIAAAGFLLPGRKRNKKAQRPFNWLDFLTLAAGPQPEPLALQARLRGFALHSSFALLKEVYPGRLRLKNLRKLKNAAS